MNMRATAFAALAAIATLFAFDAKAQAPEADLGVSKSGPATASAGSNVPYSITVFNVGPDDAVSVQLNDPMPEGMAFVSMTQNSGPTFTCTTPNPGDTTGTINCTAATLPAGGSATFTLTLNIPLMTGSGTTFTNIATVSGQSFDPNDENDSSSAATTAGTLPQADLVVTKNGPSAAQPDTDVTYTITLTNNGPAAATSVSLSDTLPGTMTFVSLTQSGSATLSCSTPAAGSGGTITCTTASMAANTMATFQLTGHIPPGTPAGTDFQNTATVTSDLDPNEENNSSSTGVVVSSSDIGIMKSGPAMPAAAGSDIAYTITVMNNGPDFAQSTQFNDPLPAGVTFVSIQQVSGTPTSTCATPAVGGTGTVSCSVFNISNGQSAQFTLTVHVGTTDPIPTQITNVVTLAPSPSDPNSMNNSSLTTTAIVIQADVSITKNGPATVTAGMDASYTIAIANGGPSPAYNLTLSDTMPANTTFGSLTAPAGWTCSTPAPGAAGAISCSATRLDPNAQANFTLVLHVSPNAPAGPLVNSATVATASDSSAGNNTATSTATVQTSADVQLTKSGPTAAGSATNVAYTVVVTNAGPSDAQNVTMTDVVPTGATFVSVSQSGSTFSCTAPPAGTTGTVSCTIGTLTSGGSTTFTITVTTPPATTTTLSNTATVSAATPDPNPANNSASASTVVSQNPADLSITKTANAPSGTLPNAPLTYTLAVANLGPSTANGVSVTDTLPANTTFVSASTTQGSCTGTTTVVCSLGTMTSGANATITINVTVGPALGPITNTATVASTNVDPDPNPANNTSTATVNVVPTIPTLSPLSLALLALGLGLCGLFVTKVR